MNPYRPEIWSPLPKRSQFRFEMPIWNLKDRPTRSTNDDQFKEVFDAIRGLMGLPEASRGPIEFRLERGR
jgi:hypothetical protein